MKIPAFDKICFTVLMIIFVLFTLIGLWIIVKEEIIKEDKKIECIEKCENEFCINKCKQMYD